MKTKFWRSLAGITVLALLSGVIVAGTIGQTGGGPRVQPRLLSQTKVTVRQERQPTSLRPAAPLNLQARLVRGLPRAIFTVDTEADDENIADVNPGDGTCADSLNRCGLRTAILEANALTGQDQINLPTEFNWVMGIAGIEEDAGLTGDLDITDHLLIQGGSALTTILSGNDLDRVFHVYASNLELEVGIFVDFFNLAITGGETTAYQEEDGDGGGVLVDCGADLFMQAVAIYGNDAPYGGGVGGYGCPQLDTSFYLISSAVHDNAAESNGGGVNVYNGASALSANTTISQNTAPDGAGFMVETELDAIEANFTTVADNFSPLEEEGPEAKAGIGGLGTILLWNSIIAYNFSEGVEAPTDCEEFSNITSNGYNIYTSAANCAVGDNDLVDPELLLGELLLNAPGTTMTHDLPAGSSAVDVTDLICEETDQRGVTRPQGEGCDSGAYELEAGVEETPTATPTDEIPIETATATDEIPVETATATPTEGTPVATATEDATIELVSNGGFEAIDEALTRAAVLDPWVLKNGTSDKIKCNKPEKVVANSGECAFLFKGGAGENSKIQQLPTFDSLTLTAGDTLDLSLLVNASNSAAAGKIKLRVKYSDSTPTGKITETIAQTSGYEVVSGSYDLGSAAVTKIKLQIINKSTAGKAYVDDVSLIYTPGGGAIIPLPSRLTGNGNG